MIELDVLSRFRGQSALPAGCCTLALGSLRPGQLPFTLQLLKPHSQLAGQVCVNTEAYRGFAWKLELSAFVGRTLLFFLGPENKGPHTSNLDNRNPLGSGAKSPKLICQQPPFLQRLEGGPSSLLQLLVFRCPWAYGYGCITPTSSFIFTSSTPICLLPCVSDNIVIGFRAIQMI